MPGSETKKARDRERMKRIRAGQGWRPIETAPKRTDWRQENARILATDGVTVSTCYWYYPEKQWRNESECEDYGYPDEGPSPGHASWSPTHWQPLPPPPNPST